MSDSRDLAHQNEGGGAVATTGSRSDNFLSMLLEAARDPNIDADKVKTMADLAVQLQDRERETQFAQDFAAALMEMPYISKRGTIVIPARDGKPAREQGKFATYEDLDKVIKPILARHNMVISFRLGSDGPMTTATPIVTHTNGYRDIGEALKVPPDTSGSKNAAQAIGSSSSYAKRYAACAHLNIVTVGEDNDASSYPLPDDPLTDRQERLVKEAEASSADGNYAQWYGKQNAKDRAWLVITGVHARCGGGKELLGNQSDSSAGKGADNPPPQSESTQSESKSETKKKQLTPEQWVEGFEAEVSRCTSVDQLDEYLDAKRDALARLKASDPKLWKRANDAANDKREAMEDGRLV